MVKYTSAREKFVYEHSIALGLTAILPEYHEVEPSDPTSPTITQVQRADGKPFDLKDPLKREDDKELIMIKTVGYEASGAGKGGKARKFIMDIKIGFVTKSEMQFSEEGAGAGWQTEKKVEHFIKDRWKGNRKTGYSILSGEKDYESMSARRPVDLSEATIKIIGDLTSIQTTMKKAINSITFVGSSILCVFNLDNPNSSEAKLIDPDHPILTEENISSTSEVPEGVLTPKILYDRFKQQEEYIEAAAEHRKTEFLSKYKDNYTEGLRNLITYFEDQKNNLEDARLMTLLTTEDIDIMASIRSRGSEPSFWVPPDG